MQEKRNYYLSRQNVGYLTFNAYQTELYYDSINEWLYVYSDKIYKYANIPPSTWGVLKGKDRDFLEYITGIYPIKSIVKSVPKGLDYVVFTPNTIVMYKVDSSNIKAVGYDLYANTLYIQYLSKGEPIYRYDNVEEEIWNGLQQADSKGSFTHWFIKLNNYHYTKVGGYNLTWSNYYTPNTGEAHPDGYMTNFSTEYNEGRR